MTRQTIAHVPVARLTEHPANVREHLGDLREMADSIRRHGILQPLTATEDLEHDGQLLLLAGHRRLRGAIMAGLWVVPVIIRHDVTDPIEHTVLMLVENTQRRELNPMERGRAYGRLRDQGLTITDIALRTGITPATVSHYLSLLLLAPEEQEDVLEGRLASTKGVALARGRAQAQRSAEHRALRGRPANRHTDVWFGPAHRLAVAVKAACDHRNVLRVGGVGCGPCWEQALINEATNATRSTA